MCIVVVLLISATALLGVETVQAGHSSSTVYVDASNTGFEDGSRSHPFDTIQEGVNHANNGGTVEVAAGTYPESVWITKPLHVEADGRAILAPGGRSGFEIRNTHDISIRGFAIEAFDAPIAVYGSYRVTISNNTITVASGDAIYMENVFASAITDNTITGSAGNGLALSRVRTSAVSGNRIDDAQKSGIFASAVSAHLDVSDNDISTPSGDGIRFHRSHRSAIVGNSVDGAANGLNFTSASLHEIHRNTIANSRDYGVLLAGGSWGSRLYDNALINDRNVDETGDNKQAWSIYSTAGPNVIGGPTIGGNYWSTPSGTGFSDTATDADGDGFADSDYFSHGVVDRAPLVKTNTNSPPTAVLVAPPTAAEGETIPLNASRSSDPDGTIVSYEWDLDDDGQFDDATGELVTTTFLDDGSYSFAVRVSDDDGATDTANATVSVTNVPPSILILDQDLETEVQSVAGEPLALNATFTDPGIDDTHTATIDWGDGTTESISVLQGSGYGSLKAPHTYTNGGTFEITLTVTDDDGGSETATRTVTVAHAVEMDVKPGNGDAVDPIRPGGNGRIPVAIYSTAAFDAGSVNVSSLRFGAPDTVEAGGGAVPAHHGHLEDVDGDGDLDLLLHFAGDTGIMPGDNTTHVVGTTDDNVPLVGSDAVRVAGNTVKGTDRKPGKGKNT